MQKSATLALIYALFLLLLLTDLALFTFVPGWHVRFIAGEDRAIEWLTFAFFLGAALTGLGIVGKHSARMDRKVICILLGLSAFYLVCAGEEISWGQRVFGFSTPEAIIEHNQQQEFNVHNLKLPGIHPRDIFSLYVYLYGIALPLLIGWRSRSRSLNWQGWVFHPGIAGCFLFAEAANFVRSPLCRSLQARMEPALWSTVCNHMKEAVEMYWALAILCGTLLLRRFWRESSRRPQRL
ncbi:MAG: hypothetical protein RBT36_09010 [Desulfobulbus sp.]|jgi:hypothetical protein|nr:hypothetical protein [Desulfobulbus sp.]